MDLLSDHRRRKSLELFLKDLICLVERPDEVGMLVEVLMVLQAHRLRRNVRFLTESGNSLVH